jgi:hypothetical protein
MPQRQHPNTQVDFLLLGRKSFKVVLAFIPDGITVFVIIGTNQACQFFWRKTFFLYSKSVFYSDIHGNLE